MAKQETIDIPGWLITALACPECGKGCVMTTHSHGMVCIRVPAHTGLIQKGDWIEKVTLAHKTALAHGKADFKVDKAIRLARIYLKRKNPYEESQ